MRRLLYVCAPWRERTAESMAEVHATIAAALEQGFAPIFAPFLFPALDDSIPAQREAAFECDLAILERCDALVLVGARVSEGMRRELNAWGNRPWLTSAALTEGRPS